MSKPPVEVPQGAIRFNTDSQKMEFFAQDQWWEMATDAHNLGGNGNASTDPTGNSADQVLGTRGIFAGGSPTISNIDYFNMASQGDAVAFGSLGTARYLHAGCSSSTRAVFGGGNIPESNNMEYITIPSTGSGTSFGNLVSNKRNFGGGGNETRGVFVGGLEPGSSYQKDIDYITIASTGAAQDFGDLTIERLDAETVCNGSRLVTYAGSIPGSGTNTMDFITIASTGDAQDFGDSVDKQDGRAAAGDSTTRGVFMGGRNDPSPSNISTINYITIASAGNTTKFGDLTEAKRFGTGTSDKIRAFCCGGYSDSNQDVIEYVTIATLGNGVDFGNLNTSTFSAAATSNGHGGL